MPTEPDDHDEPGGERPTRARRPEPREPLRRERPAADDLLGGPTGDDRSAAVDFAVRWDLLRNLWEVVDYPGGGSPRAAVGHPVGGLFKAWFGRWAKEDTERLMINGDGRYLYATGRAAPADLDRPPFRELAAGFLRGTLASDRSAGGPVGGTVTFAAAGGWVRLNFQKGDRPPAPPAKKAGRKPAARNDTLPADAADLLAAAAARVRASAAVEEAEELLARLAGTTSADPARNRATAKGIGGLADAAGRPLLYDGRAVRLQVVTPTGPAGGYFQARLVGGDRGTVYSGETVPPLTLGPAPA